MSKLQNKFFYHGAPCAIEKFDYAFTSQGDDYYGSGFYFTSSKRVAIGFCCENDVSKSHGIAFTPTLHKAKLEINNPLPLHHVQTLSLSEARDLIARAPGIEEKLNDFWEVEYEGGVDKVLIKAAKIYSGIDDDLIKTLTKLSINFYGEHTEAFNTAVRDVLGYDGLIEVVEHETLVVAWFPEQINIVSRVNPTLERDESLEP